MKRILIADDHSAIRSGIKLVLAGEFDEMEFGEASNAAEVINEIRDKTWDILILDIEMPGRNGLEILRQLKDYKAHIPVLVFSMHSEEQFAIRALKLGASGYLAKDVSGKELVNAIHQILTGRKYITPSLAEQLARHIEKPATTKTPHEQLSNREYQTLLLIASGKTVSQIAEKLSLSISTIATYRERILEKMFMKTNAELTSYAFRNNLI